MSVETVVTISAITEFIVLSAITLTLINAFSHGALAQRVFANRQEPAAKAHGADAGHQEHGQYQRAA